MLCNCIVLCKCMLCKCNEYYRELVDVLIKLMLFLFNVGWLYILIQFCMRMAIVCLCVYWFILENCIHAHKLSMALLIHDRYLLSNCTILVYMVAYASLRACCNNNC